MLRVVVIGAGIGGLSTAAVLARAGLDVIVLEAHVYPGGCAGTFYHQGYRFDAGATLAGGFYPGGPMDRLAKAAGIGEWPGRPAEPAMVVHLPQGDQVRRWSDERRWLEYRAAFGDESLAFWRAQEASADALWNLALRSPAWPPQRPADLPGVAAAGLGWLASGGAQQLTLLPGMAADALRPFASRLRGLPERLRLFIDAQLLISAQVESDRANALYAAAALDLPRRGVLHLDGGMGALAQTLVKAVRDHGGKVLFRREVTRIRLEPGGRAVVTARGDDFDADLVVANLTPWSIAQLVDETTPSKLRGLPASPSAAPPARWGAFTLYLGLDGAVVPPDFSLHHQLVLRRPLAEGNSVFLSISPAWDAKRAPQGRRALTLSTHTDVTPWWELYEHDPAGYRALREQYTDRLLNAAERILPDVRLAATLVLPGTPLTFRRFTRRSRGWVGGFQQTGLLRARAARLAPNLWMVGDSIFPGQSAAAVALGGLRVAGEILREHRIAAVEAQVHWETAA